MSFSSSSSSDTMKTYSRLLPLSIRGGMEEMGGSKTIRVSLRRGHGQGHGPGGGGGPSSELQLRLTSETDVLFLYTLRLRESEYPALKAAQGLLVDWIGFPAQLMSLLDKCGDDKFLLVLHLGRDGSVLDVVESNPFKYLSHISLAIERGSDDDLKRHLSALTSTLKKENETLTSQISNLSNSAQFEVGKLKEEIQTKDETIRRLNEQIREDSCAVNERYSMELRAEREKLSRVNSELSSRFQEEKFDLEKNYKSIVQKLEERINCLVEEKQGVENNCARATSNVSELEARFRRSQEDCRILNHEVQQLRKLNEKLDGDYHDKQKAAKNALQRLESTETQLRERTALVTAQQENISKLGEKVSLLENKNSELNKEVESFRLNHQKLSYDLQKANEIIGKLQEDGRNSGKKLKAQTHMLTKLQESLTNKVQELTKVQAESTANGEKVVSLQKELEDFQSRVAELEESLRKAQESIHSKENMVTWLNKQLNEFQGLSNLTKFRQASQLLTTPNQDPKTSGLQERSGNGNGSGDVPSWLNIYNSTTTGGGGGNLSSGTGPGRGVLKKPNKSVDFTNNNPNSNIESINFEDDEQDQRRDHSAKSNPSQSQNRSKSFGRSTQSANGTLSSSRAPTWTKSNKN